MRSFKSDLSARWSPRFSLIFFIYKSIQLRWYKSNNRYLFDDNIITDYQVDTVRIKRIIEYVGYDFAPFVLHLSWLRYDWRQDRRLGQYVLHGERFVCASSYFFHTKRSSELNYDLNCQGRTWGCQAFSVSNGDVPQYPHLWVADLDWQMESRSVFHTVYWEDSSIAFMRYFTIVPIGVQKTLPMSSMHVLPFGRTWILCWDARLRKWLSSGRIIVAIRDFV